MKEFLDLKGFQTGVINFESSPDNQFNANVYPNPTSGDVTIVLDLPKASLVTFQLADLQGKIIKSNNLGKLQEGNQRIVWDGFSSSHIDSLNGTYFLLIKVNNEIISVTKMIKQ
ncbi:MAG: T9SS type A sorting domain-containing protein [Saprospiraceae bacterium]